eukprot:1340568-Amorphochlora_amoeboformis.AAC.1
MHISISRYPGVSPPVSYHGENFMEGGGSSGKPYTSNFPTRKDKRDSMGSRHPCHPHLVAKLPGATPSNKSRGLKGWFVVEVCDPIRVNEGLTSHMAYKIKTEHKNKKSEVLRRYREFLWLKTVLVEKYPGYLVPALPEKGMIRKFGGGYVHQRMRGLQKFLDRIVNHAVFR